MRLICASIGVPWRVFIGSEAAQLASEQDTKAWNKRITKRRNGYATPYIIRRVVDRLIAFGVMPEPTEYSVKWPDPHSPSDEEKANVAEKKTNAIAKYVQAGGEMLVPPFHYLTNILDVDDESAREMIEEAEEIIKEEEEKAAELTKQQQKLGNGNGRMPASSDPQRGAPAR